MWYYFLAIYYPNIRENLCGASGIIIQNFGFFVAHKNYGRFEIIVLQERVDILSV